MVKPSDRTGYAQHVGDIRLLDTLVCCFEPRQCKRATVAALYRFPMGLVGHDFHHRTEAAKFIVVIPNRYRAGRADTCRTFACRLASNERREISGLRIACFRTGRVSGHRIFLCWSRTIIAIARCVRGKHGEIIKVFGFRDRVRPSVRTSHVRSKFARIPLDRMEKIGDESEVGCSI